MRKNAVKTLPIHNMAPNINEAILLNIDVQYFALPLSVSPASFLHFHSASSLPICKNKMHNTLEFFPANPYLCNPKSANTDIQGPTACFVKVRGT